MKLFLFLFLVVSKMVIAQETMPADTLLLKKSIALKYIQSVSKKAVTYENVLTKKAEKSLRKMKREEMKFCDKVSKIDSLEGQNILKGSFSKYEEFEKKLKLKASKVSHNGRGSSIQYLDTLKGTLDFLSLNSNSSSSLDKNLVVARENVESLKNRFDQLQQLQEFLKQRRAYLMQRAGKIGLAKRLKKLNKEVFYYTQTLKSYKEVLSSPKRVEKVALGLLKKIPAFKNFIAINSQFSNRFTSPVDVPAQVSLVGLQSRFSTQQAIRQNYPGSAQTANFVQKQMQLSNNQLSALKNKFTLSDAFGNPAEAPDFKPNMQKTKPFLKRFEYGFNVQFGAINNFLPAMADLALSIGYKVTDTKIIGIGVSYKLGLGKGINDIQFSNQGYTLRSFIDWKLKGRIYLSGGYEKLYLSKINETTGHNFGKWQESGLIGLSKKYKISKKLNGTLQLYYDFLSEKSIPRRQPIVFRTGWNL
jgi:hypothetical protein